MRRHVVAVAATQLAGRSGGSAIRVLDAGCGDGQLMADLQMVLPEVLPGVAVEVFGFDVHDADVQRPGFDERTVALLSERVPDVEWRDRLAFISEADSWPYPNGSFDVVVSNQVGEHVARLDHFFAETARVLADTGTAVHVFPLRDYVYEGHLLMPLVHRVLDHDARAALIRLLSRLGFGKYRQHVSAGGSSSLEEWAERHSDYVQFLTRYRKWPEVAAMANRAGLRTSHRYTADLYLRKLASQRGRDHPMILKGRRNAALSVALFWILKRVSSVTVLLERAPRYRSPVEGSGH